ncbi:hypothetical protein NKI12_30675 [Mesorhizobium australicum]|uniref:Uncharacterized protein n=1 Tax=Mesorhizobium australicum TaxID=536018 RepID=A0ACC6T9A3_9HYPH
MLFDEPTYFYRSDYVPHLTLVCQTVEVPLPTFHENEVPTFHENESFCVLEALSCALHADIGKPSDGSLRRLQMPIRQSD